MMKRKMKVARTKPKRKVKRKKKVARKKPKRKVKIKRRSMLNMY